ncbi:hypothetical protein IV102_02005 [bacterium]|nr:hypothetical protein [bacterium]
MELQKTPVGPPLVAVMNYNGQSFQDLPASPGFGWTGNGSIRVREEPNGDLIYEDEFGQALRWSLQAGNYIPYLPDNYSDAEKVVGNPSYVYAITFPDQSRREFDVNGKILRELDRNNNTATYSPNPDGSLNSITDATLRTLVFGYGTRTDGQPVSISSNGRQIQFVYYPDTHPVSPNRLQAIIDPVGDTQSFVYSVDGLLEQVIDTRGNVAKRYTYDNLGRKLSEQDYDQSVIFYDYLETFGLPGVAVTQVDLTADPDPDRSRVTFYDLRFRAVEIDELVDPVGPVVNTTLMAYTDGVLLSFC